MTDYIVKLTFTTPLRIGREKIGLEGLADGLHSDTLFSALCHVWVDLYGQDWLEDFLQTYGEKPPFILSSAFPFHEDIFFFPRPMIQANLPSDAEIDRKSWKELKWLSADNLKRWLDGEVIDPKLLTEDQNRANRCSMEVTVPRVAIDRIHHASNIFYCSHLVFDKKAGLFCILRIFDPSFLAALQGGFEYLGDYGLGSERNNGYGCFRTVWLESPPVLNDLLNQQGSHHYLLSLYNPQDPQAIPADAHFTMVERRGYFYSVSTGAQFKRRTVWMLQEGSVLPAVPQGRLVDVTPSVCGQNHHRIYRNGIPLTIQFKG